MQDSLILEWVTGSLKKSSSFCELKEEKGTALKNKILKDLQQIKKESVSEFVTLFVVKVSRAIEKANWVWYRTDGWPFVKWEKIKKEARIQTMSDLGLTEDQMALSFLNSPEEVPE